jgi:hypothetical protein
MVRRSYRPLHHARARRYGAPFMLERSMDSGGFESCSLSLSVGFGHDPGQARQAERGRGRRNLASARP